MKSSPQKLRFFSENTTKPASFKDSTHLAMPFGWLEALGISLIVGFGFRQVKDLCPSDTWSLGVCHVLNRGGLWKKAVYLQSQ